jgi:Zn-dependent protease with chaperone function
LKLSAVAIGAPFLTLATTIVFDKATNIIIDKLIKAMKLPEDSRAYKILTTINAGKSRILQNPIIRYIIALQIFAAYNRYREKQADLFAAQYGYEKGGEAFFERIEKSFTPFEKALDVMHPSPAARAKYLREYK